MTFIFRRIAALQVLGTTVLVLGAGVPKPCCAPEQWEAVIFQQNGAFIEDNNRATYENSIQHMSYDHHAKKIAIKNKVLDDSSSTVKRTNRVVEDFNQKTLWVIEGTTCTKQPLPVAMTPPCINGSRGNLETFVPQNTLTLHGKVVRMLIVADAVSVGSHVYGGVTSNTWVWRSGNVTSRVTLSNDESLCFPLVTTTVTTGAVWSLTLSNFQNVTEGIKDPSVFDLPDDCHK